MAAVSAPLRKGVSVLMTDVILLLTFAVVLTAVNEIIKNIKKKGSILNVGVRKEPTKLI